MLVVETVLGRVTMALVRGAVVVDDEDGWMCSVAPARPITAVVLEESRPRWVRLLGRCLLLTIVGARTSPLFMTTLLLPHFKQTLICPLPPPPSHPPQSTVHNSWRCSIMHVDGGSRC